MFCLRWLRIGDDDPILCILPEYLEKILEGDKDLEIRDKPSHKHKGRRIWLAGSGTKTVYGHTILSYSMGPLSEDQWSELRERHHVQGPRMYGPKTYAHVLRDVCRVDPIPIERKWGCIGFQTGPWA